MNCRLVAIAMFGICLVACTNNIGHVNHPIQEETTVDFQKAALLNVEMGEAYLAQNLISRAKQKFIHALELKPKLPEAHSSIGYFYERVGDLPEAELHYKQAISYASGGKGRFYNNYGTFLCRQSRYKEADKAFNLALKDKQYIKTAEVYENAGLCSLKETKVDKAEQYLKTAIRRDPSRATASLELANIEYDKHNYVMAKEYLNNFKATAQANPRALLLGIKINKILGDKTAMANDVHKLKNMFPNSVQYRQYVESAPNER